MVFPASFDCSKAQTNTEKAICSDAYLSALDSVLGATYNELINKIYSEDKSTQDSILDEIKNDQRKWIKQDRKACKSKTVCLRELYQRRIDYLKKDKEKIVVVKKNNKSGVKSSKNNSFTLKDNDLMDVACQGTTPGIS